MNLEEAVLSAAAKAIDEHRKADATVLVTGADGRPEKPLLCGMTCWQNFIRLTDPRLVTKRSQRAS